MKKWKNRAFAAILAGMMLLSLTACGNSGGTAQTGQPGGNAGNGNTGNSGTQSGGKTKLEYVYRPEILEMPEGLQDVSRCFVAGDKLYLYGYVFTETGSGSVLYRTELDGSNPEEIVLVAPPEEDEDTSGGVAVPLPTPRVNVKMAVATTVAATARPSTLPADDDVAEGDGIAVDGDDSEVHVDEYRGVGAITVDEDGSFWFIETVNRNTYTDPEDYESYSYEEFTYLRHKDADGNDLLTFDLHSLLEEDADPYFYVNSLVLDKAGNIVLLANECIWVLDSDCKLLHRLEAPEGFNGFDSVVRAGDGTPVVGLYNDQYLLSHLCPIDTVAGTFGEPVLLANEDGQLSANVYYNLFPNYGSGLCLNDRQDVYVLDITTGEKTKVLNWINSDVDINEISYVCASGEDEFIACGYNSLDYTPQLMKLTYVEPSEIREKTILTLATTYLDYGTRREVINFNRSNELYRIQIRDYSIYDGIVTGTGENTEYDWNAGVNRLNADIAAGDIPDILVVDDRLPVDSYMSKGLFADLYKFLDSDPELSREMLCENVLRAMEYNGKLQTITTHFNIYTVAGKKSVVGDPADWTMEKMASLLDGRPDDTVLFSERTRNDFLTSLLAMSMNNYVDPATGLCRFDSDDFIRVLELSATFPEDFNFYDEDTDWDEYYMLYETQYRDERTLLMITYLNDFRTYRRIGMGQFGEEISLVGFPSENGSGSALMLGSRYAITAKSPNGEGAWQFLRYFISDAYYGEDDVYGFPLRRDYLEKSAQRAMKPDTYEDENGDLVEIPNTYYFRDHEIDLGYPDQAEIDFLMDFVLSVDSIYRTDEKLMNIILEDAGSYYAGVKSARDVAGLIQSRAQIYISESR